MESSLVPDGPVTRSTTSALAVVAVAWVVVVVLAVVAVALFVVAVAPGVVVVRVTVVPVLPVAVVDTPSTVVVSPAEAGGRGGGLRDVTGPRVAVVAVETTAPVVELGESAPPHPPSETPRTSAASTAMTDMNDPNMPGADPHRSLPRPTGHPCEQGGCIICMGTSSMSNVSQPRRMRKTRRPGDAIEAVGAPSRAGALGRERCGRVASCPFRHRLLSGRLRSHRRALGRAERVEQGSSSPGCLRAALLTERHLRTLGR